VSPQFLTNKKSIVIISGCAVALAMVLIASYQLWFSPRARIKAAVDKAAQAFLARDKAAILGIISDDFEQDGLSKDKINLALTQFFMEFERIKVVTDDQKINVEKSLAIDTVKVIVVVTRRGEKGFALGSFGNPYPVTLKLKRQKWWQVTRIEGVSLGF
jgi:uncharacterized membrane protein YvbJ